jgi:hypothetical protein
MYRSPVQIAVKHGRADCVKFFMDVIGVNIASELNSKEEGLLSIAVKCGNLKIVTYFFDQMNETQRLQINIEEKDSQR